MIYIGQSYYIHTLIRGTLGHFLVCRVVTCFKYAILIGGSELNNDLNRKILVSDVDECFLLNNVHFWLFGGGYGNHGHYFI
jgi:hypothetical protein